MLGLPWECLTSVQSPIMLPFDGGTPQVFKEASRCVAGTGRTPLDVPGSAWQLIVQQANVYGTNENYQWEYDS
ncbi:hypothetical protein KIN20_015871 [Parelaphostrongylus tenuis]|uniref:Uncharacterized protein n=1 Tax=Parelaphostrongylus tenuis TaxID=148309 RepID=A0AAD5MGP4_PARTN|nr:hypothetical protein KIN20_015871 [Parelaphostrongylus tenuis]